MKKENLSNIEIYGLEAMFNNALKDYYDGMHEINEEFFYCGNAIQSESFANGYGHLMNEETNERISHCEIHNECFPVMVTINKYEELQEYEITNNDGFNKLKNERK